MIDLTMTASLRPKIVEQTLQSLRTNLKCNGVRLIVDIAPVGDHKYTQNEVADVILRYYPDAIIRCLPESLQAEAVQWCWDIAQSFFILHWEDDWVLTQPLQLLPLFRFMNKYQFCGQLAFDRKEKQIKTYPPYKGVFKLVQQGFYQRVKGISLGGPPAIMRRDYIREVSQIMDGSVCLDILSETDIAKEVMKHWETYMYTGFRGGIVRDIGRPWLKKMGMKKVKRTERGVTWINQ